MTQNPIDQLLMIRIEGMHCHRCQQNIQKKLAAHEGVREVEVDFPSGLASVLYDPRAVGVRQLLDTVTEAGYRVGGFSQGQGEQRPADEVQSSNE